MPKGLACVGFTAPKQGSDSEPEPDQAQPRRLAQAGGSRCALPKSSLSSPLLLHEMHQQSHILAVRLHSEIHDSLPLGSEGPAKPLVKIHGLSVKGMDLQLASANLPCPEGCPSALACDLLLHPKPLSHWVIAQVGGR